MTTTAGNAPLTLWQLAGRVIKDSIIAQAAERLVVQIVQVCAEHEASAVEAERAACADLARRLGEEEIADAIEARRAQP